MKATPLIMIAVGLAFCYLANIWNIGAEGQFIAGARAAAAGLPCCPNGTGVGHVGAAGDAGARRARRRCSTR